MIRMYRNIVELIRWKIKYTNSKRKKSFQEIIDISTEKEKDKIINMLTEQEIEYEIEEIDVSDYIWIEGLEFDNYDDAIKALEKGKIYLTEKELVEIDDQLLQILDQERLDDACGIIKPMPMIFKETEKEQLIKRRIELLEIEQMM